MASVPICCRVRALYSFNSNDPASLTFEEDDYIDVLNKLESGWWDGWCSGRRGWFPSNYVQVIEEYDDENTNTIQGDGLEEAVHPVFEEPATLWSREEPISRRNNEYRLSLASQGVAGGGDDHSIVVPVHQRHCSDPEPSTNTSWTLQQTEDGSDCYFYNHVTGEMRSSHPGDTDADNEEFKPTVSLNSSSTNQDDDELRSMEGPIWDAVRAGLALEDEGLQAQPLSFTDSTSLSQEGYSPSESLFDSSIDSTTTSATKPPRPLPRSPSRQQSVRRTSVIDTNEPLTWSRLSAHVSLAIHNLNSATKNTQKPMLRPFATDVVNAIRTILVTSGTIDKEAPHIKLNPIVRTHHRTMMASMSKLVLSSKLTYDLSPDEISKVLSESNDLLNNVQNFIHSCQDIGVAVQHMDPKIVPSDHTILRHHRKSEAGHDYPRVKYALQKDLAESLETYGTSMHESIDAILTSLRPVHPESRVSLAALLFTQFRNLSNQTGQFLGIVEDVDLSTVSKSLLIPTLYESQRALSDRLGFLFYYMQVLTDENTPLSTTVEHVVSAAENIGDPIKTICDCIGKLVLEAKETESISIAGTAGTAGNVLRENHLSNERSLVESVILEADESIELEDVDNDVNADANSNADADADVNIDNVDGDGDGDSEEYLGGEGSSGNGSSTQLGSLPENSPHIHDTRSDPCINSPESVTRNRSGSVNQKAPSEALGGLVMQRSQTTPDTPSKKSAKLKKFFGDDAPAAAAAAAKPAVNERPWFLHYDYDVNEIVYNMEGYVKGGSLPALVERLTLHDFLDMNFINTFLLTYRSFCTSMELLNLLEARYNLEPPPGLSEEDLEVWTQKKLKLVRLRVFNVLKNWLELFYNEEDHIILDQLSKFIDTRIRSTLSFSCDQLERLIRKRKESESHGGLKKMTLSLPDPPEPILPRNRKKFRLLDIEPLEMARQLTIMDFKLYSSIRPVECLDKAWSRDTNDENGSVAVNIRASIEYCNQITAWVSEAILSQSDIKKRSAYIKYWVHVAEKCRLLNNFNTCMAVLSAFDNSSVGRLKRTWDMVGARTNLTLSQIRKLMGANRNFTEYRAMIHSINPPCIPFLGIYLQDLTFIEDGNANYLKKTKELINFAKRAKTAEVIREIQQYQSSLYQLKPVEELQSFIQGSLRSTRDEDQLYKESLKLEPREREDEKIARLLQESGFL